MSSLFRKKKIVETNARLDSVAHSIVTKCLQLQQHWADALQQRSERLSIVSKRVILSLFCLATWSLSIYLIVAGLTGHRVASLSVSRIHVPAHSIETGDLHTKAVAAFTKEEYERIIGYRRYMDSLARSPTGKAICDSTMSSHPGLLDSLAFIENMYLSQPKN